MKIVTLALCAIALSGCCVYSGCYFNVATPEETQVRQECLKYPKAHEQCEYYLKR